MRTSLLLFAVSLAAQTTVTTSGTIPAGTFESPLSFAAPLARSGNSVSCPTCGTSGGGVAPGLFSPDRPAGVINFERHKNLSIAPGGTATILGTVTGSGIVTELNVWSSQYATKVTVTVDGETTPSIQANISDLLGDAYSDTQPAFRGNWIVSSNAGANNPGGSFRLPIPFSSSVTVSLTNNGGAPAVITSYVVYQTGIADAFPYAQRLHVAVVNQGSIAPYTETDMVNVTPNKRGKLAGFGWIYDGFPGGLTPNGAALEGPFKLYLDGALAVQTSGTEDMFGEGWYFRLFDGFSGTCCNAAGTLSPSGGDNVLTIRTQYTYGAQRFFIHDPITFNNSLRLSWTCGNNGEGAPAITGGTCMLKSTVYYYTEN